MRTVLLRKVSEIGDLDRIISLSEDLNKINLYSVEIFRYYGALLYDNSWKFKVPRKHVYNENTWLDGTCF